MYSPTFVYFGVDVKLYVPFVVPYFIVAPLADTLIPCSSPSYTPVYPFALTLKSPFSLVTTNALLALL